MKPTAIKPKITRFPLVAGASQFTHGRGGWVWDDRGHEYIDFVLGMGPVVLGHAPTEFTRYLAEALDDGLMMPGYATHHDAYLESLLPGDRFQRAAFFKTGSESVTSCLRLSALATGCLGVIRCGFIGWHDALVGNSLKWHEPLNSPLRGSMKHTAHIRGVSGEECALNWSDMSVETLRAMLSEHRGRIGSFVIDAYLISFVRPETIREAISVCRENGLIVICDETKTGGRVSKLGVAVEMGLDVDLIVIGKALANGMPLSLVIGRSRLLGMAEEHRLSGTYSKEMLSVRAAQFTLETMTGADGYRRLAAVGTRVVKAFNAAGRRAVVGDLVAARTVFSGSIFDLDFAPRLLGDESTREALLEAMASSGVLLLQGHPSFVCLAHEEIPQEEFEQRFTEALRNWVRRIT